MITATANDGSGKYTQCQVTVKQHVTSISLNKNNAILYTGERLALTASLMPEDANDKTFTWSTSNASVASVNSSGTVTALKAGSVVIRATANDGSGVFAECTVTVKQYATGIALSVNSLTIYSGVTAGLTAAVQPADASDKTVTWSTSDGTVATVNSSGAVKALKAGSAVITATANDGSGVYAQCQVTVKQYVTSISLSRNSTVLYTGETVALAATVMPEDASDKTVTWSTSNASVASVNLSGAVTALKAGTAVIQASANDGSGKYDSCTVTVKQRATGITLSAVNITLYLDKTADLAANVIPVDTSDKSVTWTSSNGLIAAVDANGRVSGLKVGSASVTAKANDGSGLSAVCNVTVIQQYATGITLNASSITLNIGNSAGLIASVMPEDAYDKTVQWSSSNTAVATVDSIGRVSAAGPGTALITATATDGSEAMASCLVTVLVPVTGITLNHTNITIAVGQTVSVVTASILPENASNMLLKWTSDNPSLASVNAIGHITGVNVGATYITAESQDGSAIKAAVTVNVVAANKGVTGIKLKKSSAAIDEGKTISLSAKLTPQSAKSKTISWSSSNPSVASVDGKGKVSALTPGEAVITATASSGISAQCTVTVKSLAVSQVNLSKTYLEVDEGKRTSLKASVLPKKARFKAVAWSTSDPSIATVSATGKIATFKPGTVQITATAHNGVSASCTLLVRSLAVTSIRINKATVDLRIGRTATLRAYILPTKTRYKTITWVSSNPAIATVTSRGKIKAIMPGYVIISAISHNGIEASCIVNVQ